MATKNSDPTLGSLLGSGAPDRSHSALEISTVPRFSLHLFRRRLRRRPLLVGTDPRTSRADWEDQVAPCNLAGSYCFVDYGFRYQAGSKVKLSSFLNSW